MSSPDRHIANDDLSAYLDGAVDDRVRAAVEEHLATCAACSAELTDLRATVRLLRSLPVPAPRRSFQLGPEHARPRPPKGVALTLLPVVRALSVAAAIALLVVSGAFLFDSMGTDRSANIVFSESTSEPARSAADAAAPSSNAAATGGDPAPDAGESETNAPMAGAAEAGEPLPTASDSSSADADDGVQESDDSSQAAPAPAAESQPAPAADSPTANEAASSRATDGDPASASDDADIPWGTIAAWLAGATVALGGLWATLARNARTRPRTGT